MLVLAECPVHSERNDVIGSVIACSVTMLAWNYGIPKIVATGGMLHVQSVVHISATTHAMMKSFTSFCSTRNDDSDVKCFEHF